MLEFISLLRQRYHVVLNSTPIEARQYELIFEQLTLAEAFFRKGQYLKTLPLSCAIIGPTQAGKSSLVNILLNQPVAGVSPLAGYTVHPQGFCQGVSLADCQDLAHYFGRFQQLSQNELSKQRYDCYSLTALDNESSFVPHGVLWDTPAG